MKKFGFGGESSVYVFIVAVAIFCIILGFSFGATWRGSGSETAPFGWTEFWLNRYQTGLTILAAIFIAKQQIDAGRKQHVAQIKRSFQKELDALQFFQSFALETINFRHDRSRFEANLRGQHGLHVTRPELEAMKKMFEYVPSNVTATAKTLWLQAERVSTMSGERDASDSQISPQLRGLIATAHNLNQQVENELARLSQYWS
ncbi:hypothetical protein [Brucella pseudogrignonensis]|uniref:hypothetical protein n=1 Tax=Brucella pseudogrignonensis TaxID=419475 RepID=UPI0038D20FFE